MSKHESQTAWAIETEITCENLSPSFCEISLIADSRNTLLYVCHTNFLNIILELPTLGYAGTHPTSRRGMTGVSTSMSFICQLYNPGYWKLDFFLGAFYPVSSSYWGFSHRIVRKPSQTSEIRLRAPSSHHIGSFCSHLAIVILDMLLVSLWLFHGGES